MKLWFGLWAVILVASPGAGSPRYAVVAIRDDIAVGTIVGPLKAGLLCLPAGQVRWDQIARPSEAALIKRAERTLSGGAAANPDPFAPSADSSESAKYGVVITIRTARLKLCVAGLGIGERKPGGGGQIEATVATQYMASKQRLPDRIFTVPIHLDGRDPRKDPSVYADIVADIARQYLANVPE